MNKFYFPGYARHTVHASLCVLITLLGGCTHTNLINQGDSYAEQGRHELAMVQYHQALQLKPSRDDTRVKYNEAQISFQRWLTSIADAADVAYQSNLRGRAFMLYSKLLGTKSAGENVQAQARFQALQVALLDESLLQVKASYPVAVFGHNMESDIADLLPMVGDFSGLPNQREYSFALAAFDTIIVEQQEERSGEYISGIQIVENPEIDHLKNQIHHLNHEVKEFRRDRKKYRHRIKEAKHKISRINEEQDYKTEPDTNLTGEALKQALAQLHRAKRKLHKTIQAMEDDEERLYNTIHQLDMTPATIIEEVYSVHSYFVTHSAYILKGEVLITTAGSTVVYPLEVVNNDSYHDAQPLLNMNADPLVQISAQALTADLHVSARTVAQSFMREELQKYRAGLLASARGEIDKSSRFEKLVSYGLSGRNGVSDRVAHQMEEELQATYGFDGEFPINRLLYGF